MSESNEAIAHLRAIVEAAYRNHDTKPWPVMYTAPFGEIAAAAEWLKEHDEITEAASKFRAAALAAREKWDAEADEFNQWSELGDDEKRD